MLKCKFFQRLLNYDLTRDLMENVYEEMVGRKRVCGKWANYISEMIDLCNIGLREEITAKNMSVTIISQTSNISIDHNFTKNFTDLTSLIENINAFKLKLMKKKKFDFKSGNAETIRFLLSVNHIGNKEDANLLQLMTKAYYPGMRDNSLEQL